MEKLIELELQGSDFGKLYVIQQMSAYDGFMWAFRAGFRGKIAHNVNDPLRKDVIYILTDDEEKMIKESHYTAYFKDKMLYWLHKTKNVNISQLETHL